MHSPSDDKSEITINRREAIKRTAMLLGVAVSSSSIAGCMGADPSKAGTGLDWKPQFLDKTQAQVVSAASELILPRTDTPGAQDVGVPQFIDILYGKFMDEEEKAVFAKGLAQLKSGGFQDQSSDDQATAMTKLASTDSKAGKSFLRKLREMTLLGYFTSEEVCKNVTQYDPVPGKYQACVPMSEVGNVAWSEY
ncbi:MAG: gluconate 2-dehydrogenase subunit 3 family protein [Verrucomicrobia bacterium]|nr:gluconate 2-dehydrogenase subunit 3 family protein [Verrucomicrobiota bacterium]